MHTEDQEDSNSLSVSNFVPLTKRQTTNIKPLIQSSDNQEKIRTLSYQIVQQVSIITPLSIHPSKISEGIENYYYQRKLPSMMDTVQFSKKEEKQKVDFVSALTSLFRKAFTNDGYKFTIYLQNGGLIYFFRKDVRQDARQNTFANPLVYISTQNYEFSGLLTNEGISFRELKKRQGQRQRIIVQGQHIKLLFGYFLNWCLKKKAGVDIYANYGFDLAFRQPPLFFELAEQRPEFEHLSQKQDSCIGEKISRLNLIRLQSVYYRQDMQKIEQRVRHLQIEQDKKTKGSKLAHEYQFKISKFCIDLTQDSLDNVKISFQ